MIVDKILLLNFALTASIGVKHVQRKIKSICKNKRPVYHAKPAKTSIDLKFNELTADVSRIV